MTAILSGELARFLRWTWLLCLLVIPLSHQQAGPSHLEGEEGLSGGNERALVADYIPGEPLTPLDFRNGENLHNYNPPKDGRDPIELAGLFEGDIFLTNLEQIRPSPDGDDRNAIVGETLKWEGGVVPYLIHAQFNPTERGIIARAIIEYHNRTCIKFRPRNKERDYVYIVKGRGCSSPVGRQGGVQAVTLGDGCVYPGIAIHELMHAVGFWHEQSRPDRDGHVDIHFNNISPGLEFNFKKLDNVQNLSVTYDTSSVMHYGPYAFAKDRRYPTIVPKIPNKNMGQRESFSSRDILKINRLYNCFGEDDCQVTGGSSGSGQLPPMNAGTNSPIKESTPSTASEEDVCEDKHRYCRQWSVRGECKRRSWMIVNCRKSCNRCSSMCMDHNKYCKVWAANGECGINPLYMTSYCARSCGTCAPDNSQSSTSASTTETSGCQDLDPNCKTWAKGGECGKNPDWMLQYCPVSCDSCDN